MIITSRSSFFKLPLLNERQPWLNFNNLERTDLQTFCFQSLEQSTFPRIELLKLKKPDGCLIIGFKDYSLNHGEEPPFPVSFRSWNKISTHAFLLLKFVPVVADSHLARLPAVVLVNNFRAPMLVVGKFGRLTQFWSMMDVGNAFAELVRQNTAVHTRLKRAKNTKVSITSHWI